MFPSSEFVAWVSSDGFGFPTKGKRHSRDGEGESKPRFGGRRDATLGTANSEFQSAVALTRYVHECELLLALAAECAARELNPPCLVSSRIVR